MPDHAFELSFDPASDAAIEAQWLALQGAGIPSQADHRSMTNAPHLTLVAASPIAEGLVEPVAARIGPLLPLSLRLVGTVVLGTGPRVTVAHLVEPSSDLIDAVTWLRTQVSAVRHPLWTPHLTLARRVPLRRLPEVFTALASTTTPPSVLATRLRWWDPAAEAIVELVQ